MAIERVVQVKITKVQRKYPFLNKFTLNVKIINSLIIFENLYYIRKNTLYPLSFFFRIEKEFFCQANGEILLKIPPNIL